MLLYVLTQVALAGDDTGMDLSAWGIWTSAGWVARGVIIMLFIMLLGTIFVAVERLIAFLRARSQSVAVAGAVVRPLRDGDIATAKKICEDPRFGASYLAALLRAGLTEMQARPDSHGVHNAHRAVVKAMSIEASKLRRGMTILATVGSTAPFVGLFGTSVGVINAFSGMKESTGISAVAGGISEALVTTAFGIFVAVVGVWVYNFFNGRIDKINEELNSSESDFMDWAEKLVQSKQTGPSSAMPEPVDPPQMA